MSHLIHSRRSLLFGAAAALPLAISGGVLATAATALAGPSKPRVAAAGAMPRPSNPVPTAALRPVAELVLQHARRVFTIAAADPSRSFPAGTAAAAAAKYVKAQPPARAVVAASRAGMRLAAADGGWRAAFGSGGTDDQPQFERVLSAEERYRTELERELVKESVRTGRVKIKREKIKREKMDPDDYHRLEFHLNRVKCMEETDGIGRDKILLGGYLIRPDGFITEIPSFLVSDQFHSGDTVVYTTGASSPGRVLASSPLYGPWPGSFGLILLLTEQDPGGGMGEMLTELGARIREEVADAIIAANAAGADARDEHLSAHRAAMVDEIVMWVLTELAVWVAGLYDEPDDLISCESLVVTLPNATPAAVEALASTENMPAGTCASPTRDVMFAGEGGRYNCRLHWRAIM